MSNVHTGIVGTSSKGSDPENRTMTISRRGPLWQLALDGTDQVFTSTTIDGMLRKALDYLDPPGQPQNFLGPTVQLLKVLLRQSA